MAEKLEIEITADDKASGVLGGVREALGGVGGVASGALKAGLAAGALAVAGLTTAIVGSIGPAGDAQLVDAQLGAVLQSTGGAAGVSKDQVLALSNSLSQVTMFEDEAVTSAQSMLLTFTNIGSTVFPAATAAILDMSQATGQDLQSSAVQLGKALNDPIAGITSLTRVGVTFTEAQKTQIAAMVEAGNVAGAQTLILQELQKEFGGSATAAGATLPGQLTILKNSFGNVAENIGTVFLPTLTLIASTLVSTLNKPEIQAALTNLATNLASVFGQMIAWVQANWPTISAVISTVMAVVGQVIGIVINEVIPALVVVFQTVYGWVEANWPTIQAVIEAALAGFGAAISFVVTDIVPPLVAIFQAVLGWTRDNWPTIQAIIETVFGVITAVVNAVVQNVLPFVVSTFQGIFDWTQANWPTIRATIETVINAIQAVIQTVMAAVATFWNANGQAILGAAQTVWAMIQNAVQTAVRLVQTIIQTVMAAIRGDWEGVWNGIKTFVSTLWDGITTQIGLALDVLKAIIPAAWNAIKAATSLAWDAIKTVVSGVWDGIKGVVSAAVDDVRLAMGNTWSQIHGAAVSAWRSIKTAITTPIQDALGIIQGIVSNIISAWQRLGSFHIPLPHFRAGTREANVAGISFPIPDIGIDWYGGGLAPTVFNRPTLIGVGERGAEVVSVTPVGSRQEQNGRQFSIVYNDYRPVVGDTAVVEVLDRLAWKLSMRAA